MNELRKNLIRMKPSLFKGPIPRLYSLPTLYHGPLYHLYTLRITCCVCVSLDTTRPMREGEQTGREYHFVTRELFEYMVCNNRYAPNYSHIDCFFVSILGCLCPFGLFFICSIVFCIYYLKLWTGIKNS